MKQPFKKAVAALMSVSMLMTGAVAGFPCTMSASAADCVIDTSTTYQNIRGFGGINHPEWTGSDLSAAQRETAFGNGPDQLGMTVLRVFVNPDKNQWNKALATAQYATKNNVTVFASPWEPPSSLGESGGGNGKLHVPSKNYGAYAKHLNDFGQYMKDNGVDLYSISVQNEPDYAKEWTYWSTDEATSFIANYGDQITSTRLMSPESFQYGRWAGSGKEFYKKIMANSKAMANCDLFGTHFYGTSRNDMDFPDLEKCGKEIWMTEVYVPNSDKQSANRFPEALAVAENIHNGLVVGNMSAYVWWYIRREYGPMTEDGKVSKRGAMMAQYSKWVRPGAVRIAATEFPEGKNYVAMDTKNGNYGQLQTMVSAYKKDDQITVVAINPTPSAKTQSFTISSGEKIANMEAYQTTSSTNFTATTAPSYSDSSFSASLPAQSVTTFVISTGEAEPDPNGYLFHYTFENTTDGFTGRGGASVTATTAEKYEGSKSLYCTDRTATWNGASHSLSGSFKAGESYSFSAIVKQNANNVEKMHFSIQYTGTDNETHYDKIDTQLVPKGEWTQLANTSYTIPAGATGIQFYIETDGDDGTTCDFYVDEVIGAPKGKVIDGPHPEVTLPPEYKLGDLNGDGKITAADLSLAKKGIAGSFADSNQQKMADVNYSGAADHEDLEWYVKFLTGQIKEFPEKQTPAKAEMRLMSEYTPIVAKQISEYDPQSERGTKNGVNYGELKKGQYQSTVANKTKPYYILLPANYSTSKKYPVLYVMHGYYEKEDRMILNGNNKMYTQNLIGNAIASGEAEEMIVVFPYVFTSQRLNECTGMNDENNKAYDDFEYDLIQCLMPHIESTYSVATGRENTAITGFSMGGRESLNIGTKHSDLFGYVGSICAAPGATPKFKWSSEAEAPSLILMTAGSNDQTVGTIPSGYHNDATSANCPHVWHYVQGGYHGDNCIHAHIYNFIRVIFKA